MTDPLLNKLAEASNHLQNFDFVQAAAAYKKVLDERPNNAGALMGLGMVYNRTGHNKLALEIFRRIWALI